MIVKLASNTLDHAKHELDLIGMTSNNKDEVNREARKNILELLKVFSKQGHSGFSAAYVSDLFDKLVKRKTLSPLTGKDDEWNDTRHYGSKCTSFQNKRMPSVFKDDKGKCYDVDGGPIFEDKDGITFTNRHSSGKVEFPYTQPKRKTIKECGMGFCPKCGEPGIDRIKCIGPKTVVCKNGHNYKEDKK